MRRFHQCSPYQVTLNYCFENVITGCAEAREEGTWITPEVKNAWIRLHELGYAHSIEVWQNGILVGGVYGVAQGRLFCGESMFSRKENASKTALLVFCHYFSQHGGQLIDCQVINPHTASLGAVNIPRRTYLNQVDLLRPQPLPRLFWVPQVLFTGSAWRAVSE